MSLPAPIDRSTLFEVLAAKIEEWILTSDFEPGFRLPSEAELAESYGVSRPVVREALAKLRERGLIETVNGAGTFVRRPGAQHLTDVFLRHLQLSQIGPGSVADLYEARMTIEIVCASSAASRAGERDVETISQHLAAMESGMADPQAWTRADVAFHLAIADATKNPFFPILLAPLVKVIESGMRMSHRSIEAVNIGLQEHHVIYDAIAAGDQDGAAEAMRHHLVDSQHYFESAFSIHPGGVVAVAQDPQDGGTT